MQDIHDYLQTQALSLNADEIALARIATQVVLQNGQAHIEPQLWQHADLSDTLKQKQNQFKQIFMALDAVFSRQNVQTATLYGKQSENSDTHAKLLRLAQQGLPIETVLPINDESVWQYLAARTANSGWANIAEDVAKWLQIGELRGEHNRRAASQISLPVCGEDGVVYGVLHLENAAMLPENALADWVGFVLGVLPTLRELFPKNQENTDEN